MKLVIAEKKELAEVICKAFKKLKNQNYSLDQSGTFFKFDDSLIISWTSGHILESKPSKEYNASYEKWKLEDLPYQLYPLKLQPIKTKIKQYNSLVNLINSASEIIHAGDPDDEGQLLIDELLFHLNNKKPVKRLLINDLNIDPVAHEIKNNIKDNRDFIGLYNKALSRQVADMIFGFSLTTACTLLAQQKGSKELFSVGRVQTPLLALIVNRYKQNKEHKKIMHYKLNGIYQNIKFNLVNTCIKDHLNENDLCLDRSVLENIKENFSNKVFQTETIEKEKTKNPPLPFNLLDLQSYANKKFGLLPDEVLSITQSLRDKHQAITYNRSDCSYLTEEQYKLSASLIDDLRFNIESFNNIEVDKSLKSKAFDDSKVTAHTGIIPVKYVDTSKLTDDEKSIYLALCERFLMQFMKPIKFIEIKVIATCENIIFQSIATKVLDLGFKKMFVDDEDEEGENINDYENYNSLNNIGRFLEFDNFEINDLETKPPAIFTVATLLNSMKRIADFITNEKTKELLKLKDKDKKDEHGSLGTPATRHTFINLLQDREYIKIEKNKVIPTEKGLIFIDQLPSEITDPDITALLFEKQMLIEKNDLSVDDFVNYLYRIIARIIEIIKTNNKFELLAPKETSLCLCPICKSGEITEKPKVFKCNSCDFIIFRSVASKNLSSEQAKTILTVGKSKLIKGFLSKANKKFDAMLVLNTDTKRLDFEFQQKTK